jgi:hypothetical protein
MGRKRCAACGDGFTQRRNVPSQQYCSKSECQRERRRRWRKEKLSQDADYRANQAAAQRRWHERHPEYWRRYRQSHPEYTAVMTHQILGKQSRSIQGETIEEVPR